MREHLDNYVSFLERELKYTTLLPPDYKPLVDMIKDVVVYFDVNAVLK